MTKTVSKADAGKNALWLGLGIAVGWLWIWGATRYDMGAIGVSLLVIYLIALSFYAWRGLAAVLDAINYVSLEAFGLGGLVITFLICLVFGLVIPPLAMVYWSIKWMTLPA